jgi:hypothetical protein
METMFPKSWRAEVEGQISTAGLSVVGQPAVDKITTMLLPTESIQQWQQERQHENDMTNSQWWWQQQSEQPQPAK